MEGRGRERTAEREICDVNGVFKERDGSSAQVPVFTFTQHWVNIFSEICHTITFLHSQTHVVYFTSRHSLTCIYNKHKFLLSVVFF